MEQQTICSIKARCADFTVNLRSLQREGTSISYWYVKLPQGMAIGYRRWCDVVSAASEVESTAESKITPP
jgi:next-to-BRCA1 protein 1